MAVLLRLARIGMTITMLIMFVCLWVLLLQGSTDLSHWVDLKRHTSDTTLKLPGQYGSWQVTGHTAAMPFRAFRVKLTGGEGAKQQGFWIGLEGASSTN